MAAVRNPFISVTSLKPFEINPDKFGSGCLNGLSYFSVKVVTLPQIAPADSAALNILTQRSSPKFRVNQFLGTTTPINPSLHGSLTNDGIGANF